MKEKKLNLLTLLLILLLVVTPLKTFAQAANTGGAGGGGLDPKVEVMLTMSGYGAVGGALLGVASLAYGTKFRAVFIGASLGLYAGILFGGYILASHYYMRQSQVAPQVSSPYYEEGMGGEGDVGYHWRPYQAIGNLYNNKTMQRSHVPKFYMNFLNLSF